MSLELPDHMSILDVNAGWTRDSLPKDSCGSGERGGVRQRYGQLPKQALIGDG
jgi:hypothetical protein